MNWTSTDYNSSREIPRYICIFFVKLKKNFSFLFFKNFFSYFLLKFHTTPPLLLNFHFHIFLGFFLIREKIFFFLLFFHFFLSLVFLSYFLLKSSNTPLLFLNFHFTITLQKKRERSPIFKLNFIYISKFWVFVFVFKYFISKSLTSMLILIFVFQYVI